MEGVQQLSCARCGGTLPARLLAPELTCPHCGHAQRIDPEALASLERYRDEAARDFAEADAHRHDQRVLAAQKQQMHRSQMFVMAIVAPMVIGTTLGMLLPLAHGAGLVDMNAMSSGTKTAIFVVIAVISLLGGAVGLVIATASGRRRVDVPVASTPTATPADRRPASSTVLCPRCGGPNELHVGVATEACHYCAATFTPGEAIRAEGLDQSERTRREAALARYRQERTFVAGYGSQNQAQASMPATVIGVLIPGIIGPILCLGTGMGTLQTLTGAEEHPWLELLGGAVLGAALIVVAGIFGWITMKKKGANAAAKLARARAFGGTPIRGLVATAAWLSRHWAGPYELQQFYGASAGYVGAEGWSAGYPWLFEMDPDSHAPRAQVFVAAFHAQRPSIDSAPDDVQRIVADLRREGAEITMDEAGALVRLPPSTVTPERITSIRDRLVFAVARVGGRPLSHELD